MRRELVQKVAGDLETTEQPLRHGQVSHGLDRHLGEARKLPFEEFCRWCAEAGFGSVDVGVVTPEIRRAVESAGLVIGSSDMPGIRDLLSKAQGSTNPINVVRATMECLMALRSADDIAALRGKTAEQLLGKRGAELARTPHEVPERREPMNVGGGGRGR